MSDPHERQSNLEIRVEKLENSHLEYEKNNLKMLNILTKIEAKLIGSIETDTPGLLSQVRLTKEKVDQHDVKILLIESKLPSAESMNEIKDLKEKVELLNRYKWMIYGVMVVLGYLISTGIKLLK